MFLGALHYHDIKLPSLVGRLQINRDNILGELYFVLTAKVTYQGDIPVASGSRIVSKYPMCSYKNLQRLCSVKTSSTIIVGNMGVT